MMVLRVELCLLINKIKVTLLRKILLIVKLTIFPSETLKEVLNKNNKGNFCTASILTACT